MIKFIDGGVCAPKGFTAGGIHCGIRKNKAKLDLGMIVSAARCAVAATYTTNKVKGAPILVSRQNLADGYASAVICNSGNANTCCPNGVELAKNVCRLTADALKIPWSDVIVSSTGVIGQEMILDPFAKGIPVLAKSLSADGSDACAKAIMTTDTTKKEFAAEFEVDGKTCKIGAIAKGSGMINPNMATMLCFITTDAAVSPKMLQKALSRDIIDTFNQISIDGDTSTNDSVFLMANGLAGNPPITDEGEGYAAFCEALHAVTKRVSRAIAKDGEGATKLIECIVTEAPDTETARRISKTVISSDLLKSAMFGADANWGRILCAIGYTEGDFDVHLTEVDLASEFGSIKVCKDAKYYPYSEDEAAKILQADEIQILVNMHQGSGSAAAWGCDLTYDYVKINGDYRT